MVRLILLALCASIASAATCPDGTTGTAPVNGLCPSGTNLANGCCCSASASCVDKINPNTGKSDCPNMVSYCTLSNYRDLMTTQCPKTCGFCSSVTTTTVSACADKINPSTGKSDCPGLTNYCALSNYRNLMIEQCPKTCGFCR